MEDSLCMNNVMEGTLYGNYVMEDSLCMNNVMEGTLYGN